jgi:hypothetical protein
MQRLLIYSFCILFLTTCKKYPEDKGINIRQAKWRIFGDWELNRVLLDGNDVTQQMDDSVSNRNFKGIVLQIYGNTDTRDTPRSNYSTQLIINPLTKSCILNGKPNGFAFQKHGNFEIALGGYNPAPNDGNLPHDNIFYRHINGKFKILRLQNHDFKLQSTTTNIIYEFSK